MITVRTLLGEVVSAPKNIRQRMADTAHANHEEHVQKMFPGSTTLSTQSLHPNMAAFHHSHSSIVKDKGGNLHHVISVSTPSGEIHHEVHPIKMHIPTLD